jgi:hypothetical protein
MIASRRLTALVCAVLTLAVPAAMATPALGAGNAIINDCQSHGQLTHPYTVTQLRHALAVMPATVKQYTSCFDVVQSALVSARKNHGVAPAHGGGGGSSSFLPTPVIIIIVVVLLAAVTFGALAIRRRRAGTSGGDAGAADAPQGARGSAGEGTRTRVMPTVPPRPGADDTAETQAMPSLPLDERSGEEPTRVDEPEDDKRP